MMKQGISPSQLTAAQSGQTDNLYSQIQQIQSELSTKQAQLSAMQKYGVKDSDELMQDAQGNWIPKEAGESEIGAEKERWREYYGYPKELMDVPPIRYPEHLAEYEQEVATAKQRLTEDYQNYLSDIQTGNIRVGTDFQKQQERALEDKLQLFQQQEFNVRQNGEALNRPWRGRGGLFSGARQKAGQEYMTQEDMARERYTTGWEYQQAQQKTGYERSMEDYAKMQERAGATHQRGQEDIGLQKIKDIRSLQETYQRAMSHSINESLERKYAGYSY
jgi:hypothetical protein